MKKQTMLIVTVRASDAVEGCGGVIAKYAAEGHHVELIVLSDAEGAKREPLLREVPNGAMRTANGLPAVSAQSGRTLSSPMQRNPISAAPTGDMPRRQS